MKISMAKMQKNCDIVSDLLRALSHPQRLMILGYLSQGEKSVSELQELCSISQSQLSQFLNRMHTEGLIKRERKGKFQNYSVQDKNVLNLIEAINKIFC